MGGTHNYKNSRAAKLAIFELGEDIAMGKLPAHFGALSFVFTGSGNVSQVKDDLLYYIQLRCSLAFLQFL